MIFQLIGSVILEKLKRDRSLSFVYLDDECKVKHAIKIFWRKHSPITTYDNLKADY